MDVNFTRNEHRSRRQSLHCRSHSSQPFVSQRRVVIGSSPDDLALDHVVVLSPREPWPSSRASLPRGRAARWPHARYLHCTHARGGFQSHRGPLQSQRWSRDSDTQPARKQERPERGPRQVCATPTNLHASSACKHAIAQTLRLHSSLPAAR